jgi:AsmA protein
VTGSLVAQDISIADDPAFAATPFLQAKRLRLGIELGQFLFHRTVRITNFAVESPEIRLIQAQTGKWNFSSLGSATVQSATSGAAAQPASPRPSMFPELIVAEAKINHGTATVSSLPATGKPLLCSEINLSIAQFSFARPFPFQLAVKLPADGSLQVSGTAGPVSQANAAATPFQAALHLKRFDPVAAGVVEPNLGISMLADFDSQLTSDGTNLQSVGKLQASKLKLAPGGSSASQLVEIDYTVTDNLNERTGEVSDVSLHIGSVAVHVKGAYHFTQEGTVLDLHLSASELPIDQVEQLLPVIGVRLPSGSRLRGGTLSASLAITGTTAAPEITGSVGIDNTQLMGFDLGSKIEGMNPFGGSGGGTAIERLSTELKSTPQTTQFNNIYASIPHIGAATGEGTVSPSGALDILMYARFGASPAPAGKRGDRTGTNATSGVPLSITGTASAPSIHARIGTMLKQDMGGLVDLAVKGRANSSKGLKKLFGK